MEWQNLVSVGTKPNTKCQGVLALDAEGESCLIRDERAARWCVVGGLLRCDWNDSWDPFYKANPGMWDLVGLNNSKGHAAVMEALHNTRKYLESALVVKHGVPGPILVEVPV